jgi:2,5-diamino-6-(ribosylamino)-4(3H)-pyrimidinone 5'-phosphate reductase
MIKPITTLFMIQSLDGKISTGDNDNLDVDKDFKRIVGIKEGLQQYYNIEKTTDRVSFNSGRVMAKVGINEKEWTKDTKDDIDFVVVDSSHMTTKGCEYFAKRSPRFFVITTNKNHPAFDLQNKYQNIVILFYENKVDFIDAFKKLKEEHDIEKMTIQTGGTINAELLRLGLIDKVSPSPPSTLPIYQEDLLKIKALKLVKSEVLENSYLHVQYEVINETKIENE